MMLNTRVLSSNYLQRLGSRRLGIRYSGIGFQVMRAANSTFNPSPHQLQNIQEFRPHDSIWNLQKRQG